LAILGNVETIANVVPNGENNAMSRWPQPPTEIAHLHALS
jgi:hypothetical protein